MHRVLLAPDSFKGTMRADEICEIWKEVIIKYDPKADIHCMPMADGGEGLTEAYLRALGGERIPVMVTGPLEQKVDTFYGCLPDGRAVIEMAAAAGLPLAGARNDPMTATTFGVGEMLMDAARRGIKQVLLGLGGSATNDGGIGMAAALGYQFYDELGNLLQPLAKNLGRVFHVRRPDHLPALQVVSACDVNNPLCGADGATYTFGQQKGVTEEQLPVLDAALANFACVLHKDLHVDVLEIPGAGAAGGLGAAVIAFLGGRLKPGIELMLDAYGFDALLNGSDWVFTGEGRIDGQSTRGKVPSGVGLRCKAAGVPCIALCGSIGEGAERIYDCGITAYFSAVSGPMDLASIRQTCRADMRRLMDAVMRLLLHEERKQCVCLKQFVNETVARRT
ncbi:MAG: glycerate kinase [Clostridia bacterium]